MTTYGSTTETVVELTEIDLAKAGWIAIERTRRAIAAGRQLQAGELADRESCWSRHVLGANGECAFAKYLGIRWRPRVEPDTNVGDVEGWQVRTRREDWHDLILRPSEQKCRFVLVVGCGATFSVRGWIDAEDARTEENWNARLPDPGYVISQANLTTDFTL